MVSLFAIALTLLVVSQEGCRLIPALTENVRFCIDPSVVSTFVDLSVVLITQAAIK